MLKIINEITQEESKKIDLILEFITTFNESFLLYTRTFWVFEQYGIDNKRAEYICEKLYILKVIDLKHEGKRRSSIHINNEIIRNFLAKGGMTDIWLERESKRINIELSKKTIDQFPMTKTLAIIGSIISILLLLKELYTIFYIKE